MRFLIDNALSPQIARILAGEGHDAVHIQDLGLAEAPDVEILERAAADQRVVVTADTDFGTLLAQRNTTEPSVILFRSLGRRRPFIQAQVLLLNLPSITDALETGCVAIIEEKRVRLRMLRSVKRCCGVALTACRSPGWKAVLHAPPRHRISIPEQPA